MGDEVAEKNRVGPFIAFFPLNLEEQIDNMHYFFATPEKKFKEGGGVEDCPANTIVKFKISMPTQAEILQVQAPAANKGGGSWFLLAVSAKALTTPGPCKHGLGMALREIRLVICTKSVATVTSEMPQPQKELAIYPGASHIDALHCPSGIAIEVRGPKRRARTSLAHE